MPLVLRRKGYHFMFFASDKDEPPHVHVKKNGKAAKFWLAPIVMLESNHGFRPHELNRAERLVDEHRELLLERWNDFFG